MVAVNNIGSYRVLASKMDGAWSVVLRSEHGLTKNGCLQPNIGAVGKFINLFTFLHLAGKDLPHDHPT